MTQFVLNAIKYDGDYVIEPAIIEIRDDDNWRLKDEGSDEWLICAREEGDYHVKMKDFCWYLAQRAKQ